MRRVRKISGPSLDIGREFYEVPNERWEKVIMAYRQFAGRTENYRGPCPMPEGHFIFEQPERYGYERIDSPETPRGEQGRLL